MKKLLTTAAALALATAGFSQAFFTSTAYRGAFGTGTPWTQGWTNFDPQNTVYPGDAGLGSGNQIAANAHLTGVTNWTNSNFYVLNGPVYVDSLATLNIAAGTVIRGIGAPQAFLCVRRGGKINVNGTALSPVIMTSSAPAGSRIPGDWSGLLICGSAPINVYRPDLNPQGTAFVSGQRQTYQRNFEAAKTNDNLRYGGGDNPNPADNSGSISYLRIEFAGDAAAINEEFNGLMIAGVGSGTSINYVQSSFSNDDSFEWYGGTVNAKYLVAFAGADDDFDVDEGFNGKVQFALALRHPNFFDDGTAGNNSNGFEADNNTGGTTSKLNQFSPTPTTQCTFSNVTYIGAVRDDQASSVVSPRFAGGINLRTNPAIGIFNTVVIGAQDAALISVTPDIAGAPLSPNPRVSNLTKFSWDSTVIGNTFIGADPTSTTPKVTASQQPNPGPFNGTPILTAADLETFVENATYNSVIDNAIEQTAGNLGITQPWYTNTAAISQTKGFAAATTSGISFATFNPALSGAGTSINLTTGASFTHPRLANFLSAGDLVINAVQTPAPGAYNNVTVTGTGVGTLTQPLNVSGTLTVLANGRLNLAGNIITGPGAVNIAAGATITTTNPAGISVLVFQNNGTKTISADVNYIFNGTAAQSTGNLLVGTRDLEVNNAGGLSFTNNVVVGGVLDLTAGAVTTGGKLIIGSTGTRQGMIDDFSGGNTGSISGNIKFRRFTAGQFRHIAAPLSGSTLTDITEQGVPCPNIREFEEVTNTWILVADPCAGDPLPQMTSNAAQSTGAKTFEFDGTLSTGVKTASIVRSPTVVGVARGWNALGNPYPSPISWTATAAVAGNTTSSPMNAYIWNSTAANYGTITAAGAVTGGASNIIAPGQGFLVRKAVAGGTATITLNNGVRVVQSTPNTFIRTGSEDLLRLTFSNSVGFDEIMVNTRGEQVEKLFSEIATAPSLFVVSSEPMTIASVSEVNAETRIALGVRGSGEMTVGSLNAPYSLKAFALNSRTGRVIDLSEGTRFAANEGDGLQVIFRTGLAEAAADVNAYVANGLVNVALGTNDAGAILSLTDAAGKVVATQKVEAGVRTAQFSAPKAAGVYNIHAQGRKATRVVVGF